jgi:hypothetical protein
MPGGVITLMWILLIWLCFGLNSIFTECHDDDWQWYFVTSVPGLVTPVNAKFSTNILHFMGSYIDMFDLAAYCAVLTGVPDCDRWRASVDGAWSALLWRRHWHTAHRHCLHSTWNPKWWYLPGLWPYGRLSANKIYLMEWLQHVPGVILIIVLVMAASVI